MASSVLNSTPEASLSLDPTATALDWLAHRDGGTITGHLDAARSDHIAPEGSAFLSTFLDQLGHDDPWPILHDLTLRGAIEFRIFDTFAKDAWTRWFSPDDPSAPLDVAALIERARAAVAPTRPSEPAEDPVHAAWLGRQMDEHKARRAAEGITIEPVTMDDADKMESGEVNPFAPLVRITARGLALLRTPSIPVVQGPPKPEESVTGLVIDEQRCEVRWNGNPLLINKHSHFALLRRLKQAEGVVTHADLYRVIHPDKISDRAVDKVACQEVKDAWKVIRPALQDVGCPWTIESVRGRGFILQEHQEPQEQPE